MHEHDGTCMNMMKAENNKYRNVKIFASVSSSHYLYNIVKIQIQK